MKDFVLILLVFGFVWLVWRAFTSKPTPIAQPNEQTPKEDPQVRHMQSALAFAKTQHNALTQKQREQAAWQQEHGHARAHELDQLSGTEFESFLAGLFRADGYEAKLTPPTGDYGADLILVKGGRRIAVQAKCYVGSVGVAAVQEALSGKSYYQCDAAWVVTTGIFTANARELANKSGVKLIGRSDIGMLMERHTSKTENG